MTSATSNLPTTTSYAGQIEYTQPRHNFNLKYTSAGKNPVKTVNFFNHTAMDTYKLDVILHPNANPDAFSLQLSDDWANFGTSVVWMQLGEGYAVRYEDAAKVTGIVSNLAKIGFLPPVFADQVKKQINNEVVEIPETLNIN